MSEDGLSDLDSNEEQLFCLVLQRIDDAALQEIAAADYGEQVDAHLASLRRIVHGAVPIPMTWVPREVLELTRNTEPRNDREHWIRLFACMILLRAEQPPHDGNSIGQEDTILRLVRSAMALGHDCTLASRRFLSWCLCRQPRAEWLDSYLAIAIMMLSIRLEDLSQSMAESLIAVVRTGHVEVWELFDRRTCAGARDWKDCIRNTLLEPALLDGKIRNFGAYLLLESDLE